MRVRVRFSPEKAGFIRRTRRHPTQVVEDLPDGSVVWQVEVPLSEDLVHLIAGYGPHAAVLEPEELRRRVVAWAKGAVAANKGILSPEGVTGAGLTWPGVRDGAAKYPPPRFSTPHPPGP